MKGYVNLTHTNNSAIEEVNQKIDEIQDDYVSKDTTELTNYYTKNDTYSKEEIDNKTTNVYRAKGSVQTYQDLPTGGNQVGDVYNVIEAYDDYPAGTNFVWTDTSTWDALGGEISVIQGVSQEDFDKLVNNETQIKSSKNNFMAGGSFANDHGNYNVAIGHQTHLGINNSSVVIGRNSSSTMQSSVAIGHSASVRGVGSFGIQLGQGLNDIPNSFQVNNDNIYKSDTHTLTVNNIEQNGNPVYAVLQGTTAPDTTTVGAVTQFYLNTTDKKLYQCKSITTSETDSTSTYEWQEVGGGSSGTKKYQHNISLWTRSNITGTRTFKAYFSIITDSADEMTQSDVFDELVANNFTGIDGLSATGIVEDTSTNEFLIIDYIIADSTFQTIMLDGFSLLDNTNKGYGFNYSDCRVNSDVVVEI